MADKLVIVESPSKSKTIEQYLGKDYQVKSSKGHIRDLAISGVGGLGIDIENDFTPVYKILPDKKSLVKDLNQALKNVKEVYLATDPDREGEAISWHLLDTLDVKDKIVKRVIFNEITRDAILQAFKEPKAIDYDLVSSQETRRILDRIIGFKLSKLLQSKIKSKSAGRVQSAALKLIVDKEKEIERFVIEEYYEIYAVFEDFEAKLSKYKGKLAKLPTIEKANEVVNSLGEEYIVSSVETQRKTIFSKPPFITSTLQQDASNKYGLSSSKTMQIAQRLYEGIHIGNETTGLITYMRTDSIRLSETFTNQASTYILKTYGKDYVGHAKKFKTKNNVQDAHEAIRPTSAFRTPESIKGFLTKEEYNLYYMIYARAIASIMKPALNDQTTISIENNDALFRITGSIQVFDGYLKLYSKFNTPDEEENSNIPKVVENQILHANEVKKIQNFTTPPPRFNEARLIKEMEELGIGRPSTYAQTILTIKNRRYVSYTEKKFVPTEQGTMTIEKLDEFFHEFISVSYSKEMEDVLDKIASGDELQLKVIRDFYNYFIPLVENASKDMVKEQPKETGELCPNCGHKMVFRQGKYGDFEACSNFPKCKYIKPQPGKEKEQPLDTGVVCPECKTGHIVLRTARKGKNRGNQFYACNNYPKCKFIASYKPTKELCPTCNKALVEMPDLSIKCIDFDGCGYGRPKIKQE
ncbi:MAG: type I DNA topoisomerase [Firmicutes bacterium]|nr:type I DNA topoisomerase [Bacillota bacterium]